MAQNLFEETKFISDTETMLFKSDKKQIIFLELWNETEKEQGVEIYVNDKKVQESKICVANEEKFAHCMHQLELEANDEIYARSEKDNAISYNIIV